jgi:LacI family transcriptional regulator
MTTIYEVAARAGVSPATVSRVLNGMNVSSAKSKLVLDAAAELSFVPNRTARSLRRKNSEVIALVIPDIENPFFTSIARGVEDVAQAAGYSVVLCNSDDDPKKESRYLGIAVSENMAGVILAAAGDHSDLADLVARKRPVVAVDRGIYGFEIDAVMVDNRAAGRAATQALADAGYKRIACITGPNDVETALQRRDGWRRSMADAGHAAHDDKYLRYANYRVEGGYSAMLDLLSMDEPPDAVFVANNLMSVGAIRALSEQGTAPPAFGMASFGDLPFTPVPPTGLVVVDMPARHLGMTAARMLLERINGDDQPPRTVVLHNQILK